MNEIVPNQQNLIIYNTLDGKVSVTMMARDGNVWMNQKQMAELFATSKQNVGQHIANILKENELAIDSVVKNFFITAADLTINYWRQNVDHLLQFQNKDVLRNAGSVSNNEMEARVLAVYEQFDQRRKQADARLADQLDDEELKLLEQQIVNREK